MNRTLEDKVIIYDDSCPMCRLYTWWFVAWGFLRPENRIGFATAPPEVVSNLDVDRARHEIPLFDRKTKETIYGLTALTFILGSRWTWLRPLFRSRVFRLCFYPIYQFITYNRRVIAGCRSCCGFDCAPDLNRFWRSMYLTIALMFALLVFMFLIWADTNTAWWASGLLVLLCVIGVVGTAFIWRNRNETVSLDQPALIWDFLGNQVTVILIAAIGLLPIAFWVSIPQELGLILTLAVSAIALEELFRRNRRAS